MLLVIFEAFCILPTIPPTPLAPEDPLTDVFSSVEESEISVETASPAIQPRLPVPDTTVAEVDSPARRLQF